MNSSLNGESLPINKRFPSAGRWAVRDLADRDERGTGDFSSLDGSGDGAEHPIEPYRGSRGTYAYR